MIAELKIAGLINGLSASVYRVFAFIFAHFIILFSAFYFSVVTNTFKKKGFVCFIFCKNQFVRLSIWTSIVR